MLIFYPTLNFLAFSCFSEFQVVNVLSHSKGGIYTPEKCYTIAEKDYIIHTFEILPALKSYVIVPIGSNILHLFLSYLGAIIGHLKYLLIYP